MADYDKVIPPGKEGKIEAIIHGNKIQTGRFRKHYTVSTNDEENSKVVLWVAGNVIKVFDFSRPVTISGFSGEELTGETVITNLLEEPIHIRDAKWSKSGRYGEVKDFLGVKVEEVKRGRKYNLRIWNKKELMPRVYQGEILLDTDFEKIKEKKVKVTVTIHPDVELLPKSVIMRSMVLQEGTTKSFKKKFRIVAARGDSLKVLKVIPSREDITVNIDELEAGKAFSGTIQIRPPSVVGRYIGSLTIVTNYRGYEHMELPISGVVRVIEEKK